LHLFKANFFEVNAISILVKISTLLEFMIRKNIPNLFTSINFICGCLGLYLAFKNLFEAAFFMVLLGTFFDLFDGFFARLLKVESQFGMQFDSMADLITSGFVPGVVMYELFLKIGIREQNFLFSVFENEFVFSFAPLGLMGFIIPLSAAIRLVRFNLDTQQKSEFRGLPTPANALFIASLPLLLEHKYFVFFKPFVYSFTGLLVVVVISSFLMNSRIRLFAFKITTYQLSDYSYQISLLLCSLPLFYFLQWVAVPILIILYLFLNVIRNSF